MAEGTYEFECMRAELLGVAKPDKDEFEKVRAERLKQEEDEREAAEAQMLEEQEEGMKNVGGRLDELNSILSSTQQKLNRFKQTACGSLSNIFNKGSVDLNDGPSTSSHSSRRNTTACVGNANENGKILGPKDEPDDKLDEALNELDALQQKDNSADDIQPVIPTEKIRAAKLDISKKMTSHFDKLDSLISKADRAEIAMTEQTKQMKKMAK